MANVNGRKSCQARIEYDVSYTRREIEEGTETHEKAFGFRLYIKENESEANSQSDPEDDETKDEANKGRNWCQIAESFGAEKPRKRVLFHRLKAVFLLGMEHVRDLGHHAKFAWRLRLVLTTQGEHVYSQGGRKVNLVILLRVSGITSWGEITVKDTLRRSDKVQTTNGGGTGNDSRRSGRAFEIKQGGRVPGDREGGG